MGHAENEDLRDAAIAEAARRHAGAVRQNILIGHEQTLSAQADEFALRVSQPGVTEHLIRSAMSCGPALAGQMLLDLIQKGINAEAELAAIKEVERMEGDHGGLDIGAMRRAPAADDGVRAALAVLERIETSRAAA